MHYGECYSPHETDNYINVGKNWVEGDPNWSCKKCGYRWLKKPEIRPPSISFKKPEKKLLHKIEDPSVTDQEDNFVVVTVNEIKEIYFLLDCCESSFYGLRGKGEDGKTYTNRWDITDPSEADKQSNIWTCMETQETWYDPANIQRSLILPFKPFEFLSKYKFLRYCSKHNHLLYKGTECTYMFVDRKMIKDIIKSYHPNSFRGWK